VAKVRTPEAAVGASDHGGWAVLVTVASDGELLDRRRVELVDPGLPTFPHHHEGSWAVGRYLNIQGARPISLPEAVALVERVRESAERCAREGLEALAAAVSMPISSISLRKCPRIPGTIEQCIADVRAQTVADSIMYRKALAAAAEARGWPVHWYDRERVLQNAAQAVRALGRSMKPPWQADHKLAASAALAAGARATTRR
jgi:hypothetical protein